MVRPRLVQEGAPIYGPGSELSHQQDTKTEDCVMESAPNPAPASGPPKKVSSLQRAAAASSSHRNGKSRSSYSKKKTSYTIGGPSSVEATTTSASSYSNDSYSMASHDGQSSASKMGSHTQQQQQQQQQQQHHHHSYSYTVGTPHREQYALSPSVAHHTTIGNDHSMMEDEPMSSYNDNNHGNNHSHSPHHYHQPPISHPSPIPVAPVATKTPTSYVIGASSATPSTSQPQHTTVEKMEGVQDHGSKMPLVVLDGANVAHYYADALAAMKATFSKKSHRRGKPEPDAQGIQVATDYFQSVGVRALVVLPQYWMRKKPRSGDSSSQNAMMETSQFEILKNLDDKGLIVASPPADDDDAYALTIAKREEMRAVRQRNGEGPGFVLSNDMFRDAQERDLTGVLKEWLNKGRNETTGPGRISYAFADMGTMDDHGERILDFLPNPRHPFVMYAEGLHYQSIMNR